MNQPSLFPTKQHNASEGKPYVPGMTFRVGQLWTRDGVTRTIEVIDVTYLHYTQLTDQTWVRHYRCRIETFERWAKKAKLQEDTK